MKRLGVALALILSLTIPTAYAEIDWPLPKEPTWWKTSGLQGVRYGNWLPCDESWNSTNDCVETVTLTKVDGSLSGKATFRKSPNFNPLINVQKWDTFIDSNDGQTKDNSANWTDSDPGEWIMPEGFKNSDGTNVISANVHLMQGNLHTDITAFAQNASLRPSLPTDTYFEVGFRSKNMKKYIGWVFSSVKDPQVRFDGDVIYIKGIPAKSPWMSGINQAVCTNNTEKATSTEASATIMLFFNTYQGNNVAEPGDLVLSSNGWWCINGIYFDKNEEELVAKVGTAHFDEFGKTVEGWLELKVKGQRARQWWGMDPALAVGFAKVAITYEDGTTSIATVVANYDKVNDWIDLKASGFHYSSPAVKMKFQAEKAASQVISTAKTVKPKKVITCVKGKITKKVTGTKCPTGYKKK